ncbi:MAG: HAD family hydrolase [Thermoguttaceae bacterium]
MPTPKFLFFDLGNVLLNFTVEQMCRQMGVVAGVDPARVHAIIFQTSLQSQYELGRISSRAFYEVFCRESGAEPDWDALCRAGADIFQLNARMLPIVAQLRQAGYRLGILSNTCEMHWNHCLHRYGILREAFEVHALSYRIGAAKPHRAIFRAAAALAGVDPREVFFTDDIPGNVAGACEAGFDAVAYTSASACAEALRSRGLRFNY